MRFTNSTRTSGWPSTVLCVCLAVLAGCATVDKCGPSGEAGPGAPGDCTSDAKITAQVRSLFAQNPDLLGPNHISVQTVRGVVYLRGVVSTPLQIQEAGSLAEQATGVTGVQNLLTIDNSI